MESFEMQLLQDRFQIEPQENALYRIMDGENKANVIFAQAEGDRVIWSTQNELEEDFVQQIGELITEHNMWVMKSLFYVIEPYRIFASGMSLDVIPMEDIGFVTAIACGEICIRRLLLQVFTGTGLAICLHGWRKKPGPRCPLMKFKTYQISRRQQCVIITCVRYGDDYKYCSNKHATGNYFLFDVLKL